MGADRKYSFYQDHVIEHDGGFYVQCHSGGCTSLLSSDELLDSYASVDIPASEEGCSKRPVAGLIFMCNDKVRKNCFRYGVFGMPTAKKCIVEQVRPGMKLFLFEFEARQLWGIYEATTAAALDMEPGAYRGAEVPLPVQVKFQVYKTCEPLSEKDFQQAIKDNYFTPSKFDFELTADQVLKLMWLFSPREIISKEVGDRGSSPMFAISNSSHFDGDLQALVEVDDFFGATGEAKKKMIGTIADSRSFRQFKHDNCLSVPSSCIDYRVSKREQYMGNVKSSLEGYANASYTPTASNLCSDGWFKHCMSEVEAAKIDLESAGARILLKDVLRDDRHVFHPRDQGKHLYANDFTIAPVRHADPFERLLESNGKESHCEQDYCLYKLKIKHLNDRAYQYDSGENVACAALQGDMRRKGKCIESASGLRKRQTQDSAGLQTGLRKDVYIDQDKYVYEQKSQYQSSQDFQRDLVCPQSSSRKFVDSLKSYEESMKKTVRKKQYVAGEDLEPCAIQKRGFVPLPLVLSHSAGVRADANGNCGVNMHNVTGPCYVSEFLEGDHITPDTVKYSMHPSSLTVTIKNDKAWLANAQHDRSYLLQRKEQAEDQPYGRSKLSSPNRVENQVQRSLVGASEKRSRFRKARKFLDYSNLLEKAPARSSDDHVRTKPSVWSRLSGLKLDVQKDSALLNEIFGNPPDSRGYRAKKKKRFLSYSNRNGVEPEPEINFTDLEESFRRNDENSSPDIKCQKSTVREKYTLVNNGHFGSETETHSPDLENSLRISEGDFSIGFKRRKSSLCDKDSLVNRDHGMGISKTVLHIAKANAGNLDPVYDCGDVIGKRRIKRPIFAVDNASSEVAGNSEMC